eukprot:scaffold207_cov267-Pinguiococcus_pyrenoidosus.AAC.12
MKPSRNKYRRCDEDTVDVSVHHLRANVWMLVSRRSLRSSARPSDPQVAASLDLRILSTIAYAKKLGHPMRMELCEDERRLMVSSPTEKPQCGGNQARVSSGSGAREAPGRGDTKSRSSEEISAKCSGAAVLPSCCFPVGLRRRERIPRAGRYQPDIKQHT